MRRTAALAAAAAGALCAPTPAPAHIRPSRPWVLVASDYRATLDGLRPHVGGLDAHVVDGDQALRLHVGGGRQVLVLGYDGEPFLRFTGRQVDVNQDGVTAFATGLGRRGGEP